VKLNWIPLKNISCTFCAWKSMHLGRLTPMPFCTWDWCCDCVGIRQLVPKIRWQGDFITGVRCHPSTKRCNRRVLNIRQMQESQSYTIILFCSQVGGQRNDLLMNSVLHLTRKDKSMNIFLYLKKNVINIECNWVYKSCKEKDKILKKKLMNIFSTESVMTFPYTNFSVFSPRCFVWHDGKV
jgi:hypothetical protein